MAQLILSALEIWGWIGLGVSAAFLLVGIDRIDASARATYAFRPLLIPGIVVLWPIVLIRWIQLETRGRS
ncbi:MAG: hypothetical protein AAFQ73_14155 [Pseudomonadota bacterium]